MLSSLLKASSMGALEKSDCLKQGLQKSCLPTGFVSAANGLQIHELLIHCYTNLIKEA